MEKFFRNNKILNEKSFVYDIIESQHEYILNSISDGEIVGPDRYDLLFDFFPDSSLITNVPPANYLRFFNVPIACKTGNVYVSNQIGLGCHFPGLRNIDNFISHIDCLNYEHGSDYLDLQIVENELRNKIPLILDFLEKLTGYRNTSVSHGVMNVNIKFKEWSAPRFYGISFSDLVSLKNKIIEKLKLYEDSPCANKVTDIIFRVFDNLNRNRDCSEEYNDPFGDLIAHIFDDECDLEAEMIEDIKKLRKGLNNIQFTSSPLAEYCSANNTITFYLCNIIKETENRYKGKTVIPAGYYDEEFLNNIFCHEIFHCFHHFSKCVRRSIKSHFIQNSVINESLASYAQFIYAEVTGDVDLMNYITKPWYKYSMDFYPYSGAKYIRDSYIINPDVNHKLFKLIFRSSIFNMKKAYRLLNSLRNYSNCQTFDITYTLKGNVE